MKNGKKLNQIPAIICYLTLLFLHTPFSVCKSSSQLDAIMLARPEEAEMQMDSEINRRVLLMQKSYISYATLRRDMTPCDRPGASYYITAGQLEWPILILEAVE